MARPRAVAIKAIRLEMSEGMYRAVESAASRYGKLMSRWVFDAAADWIRRGMPEVETVKIGREPRVSFYLEFPADQVAAIDQYRRGDGGNTATRSAVIRGVLRSAL